MCLLLAMFSFSLVCTRLFLSPFACQTLDSYNAIKPTSRAEVLKRLFVFEHDLPSHMLADVYRMADVYVSASMAEGFNLPVLEAMATGLPVIVPDKGPTAEFVHAPSAVLMPSTIGPMKEYGLDAAVRVEQFQIYRAMLYARLNKAKLQTAAKQKGLRRHVEGKYTWPAIGRRLAAILTDRRHYEQQA